MSTAPLRPSGLRLLLATLVGLLCAVSLVVGVTSPAEAAPKPAKVKGVKLAKPTVYGGQATLTIKWKRARHARDYKVKWWPVPKTRVFKERTRKRKQVAKGLAANTQYCTKVRAMNGKRKGKWSKTRCRTTPRLDTPGPVWVDRQYIESAGTTALGIRWPSSVGATSYQLDFAPGQGDVQKDPLRRTIAFPAGAGPEQAQTVGGFDGGKIYCFQVRAVSHLGVSSLGPTHCKYTMPASRNVPAASTPLKVGTYNICSNNPDGCLAFRPWNDARATAVANRVTTSGVDAVSFQEAGNPATDDLEDELEGSFTRACKVGDGVESDDGDEVDDDQPGFETDDRNQTLFVRNATWTPVAGTENGLEFVSTSRGACWVELRRVGNPDDRVVVASVHLTANNGGTDSDRYLQTKQVWSAIHADLNGRALPVVIAGDLNSHRGRDFDGPAELLSGPELGLGFDDAFDVAASYDSPPYRDSYNGWSAVPRTSVRWGVHLDRIFVSPGIHVAAWKTFEPVGGDGLYSDLLSDHSLVTARLLLPS